MPKLTLTDKEKVNLELYINFLVHNSNPCESCGWHSRTECFGGCRLGNEHQKKLNECDVADLLNYAEIKEYVDSSVKLVKYRLQVESLKTNIHNLEKRINEIMDSVDIVKDSKNKIDDDKTEFYCDNCKMRFDVPNDKCKITFDGEGALEANIRKYYRCPKCTKICWGK